MGKSADAFRTISEVADALDVQKHVLRFWEVKFPQIRPMKRGGGRRYYRPEDLVLLRGIQHLLHAEGYTIKGVQKILREHGVEHVKVHGLAATAAAESAQAKGAHGGAMKDGAIRGGVGGRVRALPKSAAGNRHSSASLPAALAPVIASAIKELSACRELLVKAAPAPVAAQAAVEAPIRAAKPSRASR